MICFKERVPYPLFAKENDDAGSIWGICPLVDEIFSGVFVPWPQKMVWGICPLHTFSGCIIALFVAGKRLDSLGNLSPTDMGNLSPEEKQVNYFFAFKIY